MDDRLTDVDDLAAYDGSVIIERTKAEMSARCDKEEMNFLAFNLALRHRGRKRKSPTLSSISRTWSCRCNAAAIAWLAFRGLCSSTMWNGPWHGSTLLVTTGKD